MKHLHSDTHPRQEHHFVGYLHVFLRSLSIFNSPSHPRSRALKFQRNLYTNHSYHSTRGSVSYIRASCPSSLAAFFLIPTRRKTRENGNSIINEKAFRKSIFPTRRIQSIKILHRFARRHFFTPGEFLSSSIQSWFRGAFRHTRKIEWKGEGEGGLL